MSVDSHVSTITPPADSSFWIHRGKLAAVDVLTGVIFAAVLLSQPKLLEGGRWLAFTGATVLFALLADRTARGEYGIRERRLMLAGQAVTILALVRLSDANNLIPMLSFITVSLSQTHLSRRWANMFDVLLIGAIALVYLLSKGWVAALQPNAVYAAGYLFIIAFTRTAQREQQARGQLEALYHDLERANQQLTEYAAQAEQVATIRERNRLARDVHDSLGHYLTVINVQLEIATKLMDTDPVRARQAAGRAKEIASEGLAEVRRSVSALRPSPLEEHSLPEAIRRLADDTRHAGLAVSFEQTGLRRSLAPESETVLYRTAQESLTNILRHARASVVKMLLAYDPDTARLCVQDNGIGRLPQDARDDEGLQGLRDRVIALKGSLRAENHPDGGFVVEVRLPYRVTAHE